MRGTSAKAWVVVPVLVLAALVLGAFAFARDDDSPTPSQIGACLDNRRAEARYLVVRAAYEWGVLGPRAGVVRSVHPRARGAIFDAAGRLREWDAMRPIARHEFLQWATSGAVYAQTKDAQTRATTAITRADCE